MSKNKHNNKKNKILFKNAIAQLKLDFKSAIDDMSDADFIDLFSYYMACTEDPFEAALMDSLEADYKTYNMDVEELPF